MYGRFGGSSNIQHARSGSGQMDAGSQGFANTFARKHVAGLNSSGSSSAPATQACCLRERPPVVQIDRSTFRRKTRQFHGDEAHGENPQENPEFASARARRTADVASILRRDSEHARYFSYVSSAHSPESLPQVPGQDADRRAHSTSPDV